MEIKIGIGITGSGKAEEESIPVDSVNLSTGEPVRLSTGEYIQLSV